MEWTIPNYSVFLHNFWWFPLLQLLSLAHISSGVPMEICVWKTTQQCGFPVQYVIQIQLLIPVSDQIGINKFLILRD